jgi:hypothetical protein
MEYLIIYGSKVCPKVKELSICFDFNLTVIDNGSYSKEIDKRST